MSGKKKEECHNCLTWHKYCDAECCRQFVFKVPKHTKIKRNQLLILNVICDNNDAFYYRLHGCIYNPGKLTIPVKKFKRYGEIVIFFNDCQWLTDTLKCKGHPDVKPEACKSYDIENLDKTKCYLTPNCRFKYILAQRLKTQND